jgi:hypothetical protein
MSLTNSEIASLDGSIELRALLSTTFNDLEFWQQLMEAVNEVFAGHVQKPIDILLLIRDVLTYGETVKQSRIVASETPGVDYTGTLIDDGSRFLFEREILLKTANLLGFNFYDPLLVERLGAGSAEAEPDQLTYTRINANVSQYYQQKGTSAFLDFMSFCLDTPFTADTLWSKDYDQATFAYGPFTIGENEAPANTTPIFNPSGTQFPTTHIDLYYDMLAVGTLLPVDRILALADYISPINLVFRYVIARAVIPMTPPTASVSFMPLIAELDKVRLGTVRVAGSAYIHDVEGPQKSYGTMHAAISFFLATQESDPIPVNARHSLATHTMIVY